MGLLSALVALISVSLLAGLLQVASVFFKVPEASLRTLSDEMLWSNVVCIEDQSPPASAMVMNSVCTCLPVQLSVVRRVSCVSPASTEIDRGTHVQLRCLDHEKPSAASLTGGFSGAFSCFMLLWS